MLNRYFSLLFIFINVSFALDIPIINNLELKTPVKQFVVIDFPFKITKITPSKFITKEKVVKTKTIKDILNTKVPVVNINNPVVKAKKKEAKKPNINSSLKIKKGLNTLTIYANKEGSFELIVWGYKKFPIILDIKVEKNDNLEQYFHFINPEKRKSDIDTFESNPHEKVIVSLLKSIYNNITPSGYKLQVGGEAPFTSGGLKFILNRSMVGNRYRIEEWYVTNLTNNQLKLYGSMFYSTGIYGVSFENNVLPSKQTTRMWLIRKNN